MGALTSGDSAASVAARTSVPTKALQWRLLLQTPRGRIFLTHSPPASYRVAFDSDDLGSLQGTPVSRATAIADLVEWKLVLAAASKQSADKVRGMRAAGDVGSMGSPRALAQRRVASARSAARTGCSTRNLRDVVRMGPVLVSFGEDVPKKRSKWTQVWLMLRAVEEGAVRAAEMDGGRSVAASIRDVYATDSPVRVTGKLFLYESMTGLRPVAEIPVSSELLVGPVSQDAGPSSGSSSRGRDRDTVHRWIQIHAKGGTKVLLRLAPQKADFARWLEDIQAAVSSSIDTQTDD